MLHNEQLRQVGIFYRGSDVECQLLYVMGDMENDTRTHHIHIVKWNGTEWKNYIHFRDYLNDNENMALQYQNVKEELESKYADDRVAYTNGKQDMIDIILDTNNFFPCISISSYVRILSKESTHDRALSVRGTLV